MRPASSFLFIKLSNSRVIRDLSSDCRLPFITGGFINSQKEVETALHCGASNITTSIPNLWFT